MTETRTPATMPAAQTAGQHIVNDAGAIFRVEGIHPYRDGDGREQVALVVTPIGTGEPTIWRRFAESPMALATEDQVAAAVDERHRYELTAALHRLATLISSNRIRVELYAGLTVAVNLPDGEITRVAELLDVESRPYGATSRLALAHFGAGVGSGVAVQFLGEPAAVPEGNAIPHSCSAEGCSICNLFPASAAVAPEVVPVEPGGDAEQIVSTVVGEKTHRQVRGWNGGFDGRSAGVECACGEKFDGFPTMVDARKILGYHIAAAKAATIAPAGE